MDERLGLSELMDRHLSDSRLSLTIRQGLVHFVPGLRQ